MAVNESIYGAKEDWQDLSDGWDSSIPSKERVKTVYFGGANYYDNTLALGVSAGKIEVNKPIDKSLSYCGLGTNSAFSHIQYIAIEDLMSATTMSDVSPAYTENRTVTNFAFSFGYRGSDLYQDWFNGNTSSQGDRFRWCPSTDSVSSSNTSRSSVFLSSFNFKNFILLIIVYCCDGFRPENDGEPRNATACTLSDYEHDVNSVRTNHPIIYAVTIQPYCRYSENANRQPMQAWQTPTGIAILDGYDGTTSAPIGEPLYTYGQTRNDAQVWILHGMTSARNVHQGVLYKDSSSVGLVSFLTAAIPSTWKVKKTLFDGSFMCAQTYREYDSGFFEECLHAAACFGCFFTPDANTATSGNLWDNAMYCGVLEDGIGNGEYTNGIRNVGLPQFSEWDTTNDTGYDPSGGGGGDADYEADTPLIGTGNLVQAGNWYVDTVMGKLTTLVNWCSSIDLNDVSKEEYFFGQNPIDCIVSAKLIFVDDYSFGKTVSANEVTINIGSYPDDPLNARPTAFEITQYHPYTFDCGKVSIDGFYQDFRDLEPYSTLTLLLPFAGSVELPTDIFMNHTCYLKETIDPITGDLKYSVYADKALYTSVTGNCSIDLSINGFETATYSQTKFQLQTQENTARFNAAASLVGGASGALIASNYGNVAGAASQLIGGIINMSSSKELAAAYKKQAERLRPTPAKLQKATSNVDAGCSYQPVILHSYPRMIEGYSDNTYKQKTGFATYTVDSLGNHEYCVVCDNVVLSGFSCTTEEQKQIKQLLEAGVYIKPH